MKVKKAGIQQATAAKVQAPRYPSWMRNVSHVTSRARWRRVTPKNWYKQMRIWDLFFVARHRASSIRRFVHDHVPWPVANRLSCPRVTYLNSSLSLNVTSLSAIAIVNLSETLRIALYTYQKLLWASAPRAILEIQSNHFHLCLTVIYWLTYFNHIQSY